MIQIDLIPYCDGYGRLVDVGNGKRNVLRRRQSFHVRYPERHVPSRHKIQGWGWLNIQYDIKFKHL